MTKQNLIVGLVCVNLAIREALEDEKPDLSYSRILKLAKQYSGNDDIVFPVLDTINLDMLKELLK